MRLVSALLAVVAVASFGFAVGALGLAYVAPAPQPYQPPERATSVRALPNDTRVLPDAWPAVFGVTPPPPPAPAPDPAPEPEAVELPPEENTTYYLTGLVAGRGSDSWAMISENDRGLVVRIGDVLIGGETVTAIDAAGVWIDDRGERQLIPVQRNDLGSLVRTETVAVADLPQAKLLAEVTIPIEDLNRRFIERALTEAGRLAATEQPGTSGGMDIVWVQRGELFDQMGLRTGDTILAVNGKTLETENLLADMPDSDVLGGSLQLEILRDGARQMLKVNLDQG